ncbi:RabGAP/TBC, partial [Violaceomyces palustris]
SNNSIRNRTEHEESMKRLRRMILTEGIPSDEHLTPSKSTYRSVVWKLLLDIRQLPISPYLELVSKGKSPVHDKVRNDTFRTLATDQGFKEKVKEEKLIRLLEAFVWKFHGVHPVYDFSYVQGMNVLAAPFLYTLPTELEAFHCFSRFIETCCPLYVQPTLEGVHRGLKLVDTCLELADAQLYSYLRSKNLSAEIYAFP